MSINKADAIQGFHDEITPTIEAFRSYLLKDLLLEASEHGEEDDSIKEQLDRARLCVKLLTNIIQNITFLESQGVEIRPNQLTSFKDFVDFLKHAGFGDRLGFVRQPTGAGKTVLMGLLTKLLDVTTLILVPNVDLLYQTREEFIDILGFTDDEIGLVGDDNFEADRKVTICTYRSLGKFLAESKNLKQEFIICDEGHRALGDVGQENLSGFDRGYEGVEKELDEGYIARRPVRVAFTATTELSEKSVRDFFGHEISAVSYSELIAAGILAKFKLIHTEGTVKDKEVEKGYLTEEEEVEILKREQIYEKLIIRYIEATDEIAEPLRTAVFCSNITECDKFATLAAGYGLKSRIVTSREKKNGDKDPLKEAEAALLSGEINFIITVNKLGEGWNLPKLNAVILARATFSPARIIQPIGRAARGQKNKPFAYIFETQWKVVGSEIAKDEDPTPKPEPEDGARRGKGGTKGSILRTPLSAAQAFFEMGEGDLDGIFEMIDGSEVPIGKIFRVDANGIATVELNSESVEVISVNLYSQYCQIGNSLLSEQIKSAGLLPLKGVNVVSGRMNLPVQVFPRREVDRVRSYKLGPEGIAIVDIFDEPLEVVGINAYLTYLNSQRQGVKPIDNITFGRSVQRAEIKPVEGVKLLSRTVPVDAYRRSEIDRVIPVYLDDNGIGTFFLNGELREIIGVRKYAVGNHMDQRTLMAKVAAAGLVPVDAVVIIGSKTVDGYLKSEVDPLMKK